MNAFRQVHWIIGGVVAFAGVAIKRSVAWSDPTPSAAWTACVGIGVAILGLLIIALGVARRRKERMASVS